jgi:hypothetical protein
MESKMNGNRLKSFAMGLFFLLMATFVISACTLDSVSAQTKAPQTNITISAEQQKNLEHLKQLSEQLLNDRDAVHSAVTQYGWDSDQVDAAQQRLLQDRQEYRSLRRSLQSAGVEIPANAVGPSTGGQNQCAGHCGSHGHGHHDCCGRANDCSRHHDNGCCGE